MSAPPKVFISHKSVDKPWAEQLARSLRRAGVDAWLDKWEIAPGDSILGRIQEGISSSTFLVLILTPDSVADSARWVSEEWQAFRSRQLSGYDVKLIPVLLRNTELPPILAHLKYIDFREPQTYPSSFHQLCTAIQGVDSRPPLNTDLPSTGTNRPYTEIVTRGTTAIIEIAPHCSEDQVKRSYEIIDKDPAIQSYGYINKGWRWSAGRTDAISVTSVTPIPVEVLVSIAERFGLQVINISYEAGESRIEKWG